jgi:uncharacterized protein YjiS (DUF1127 family)
MDLLTMVRRKIVARRIARELRALDDRTLADVGIPREAIPDVAAENARRVVAD